MEDLLSPGAHRVPRVVLAVAVGAASTRLPTPFVPRHAHIGVVPPCAHGACFTPPAFATVVPEALAPVATYGLLCEGLQLEEAIPPEVHLAWGDALEGDHGMPRVLAPPAQQAPRRHYARLPLQVGQRHAGGVIADYLCII